MSINQERIKYLLQQYAAHVATEDEVNELFSVVKQSENDEFFKGWLTEAIEAAQPEMKYDQERWDRVVKEIVTSPGIKGASLATLQLPPKEGDMETPKIRRMFPWKRVAVAASIVGLLLVAGYWLFEIPRSAQNDKREIAVVHEVEAPKTNRATVTTSDGKTIYLDSVSNGQLAVQNNVALIKTADGKIEYSQESALRQTQGDKEIAYHTLNNPRGSKVVDITLVDGSHVWLNAGSSITYPVAFVGKERKISMTGEAYFEVNPHPLKGSEKIPFFVEANGTTTEVLGTHFNVNAYDDEDAIRVTLLEGSVRVSKSDKSNESVVTISPGQQAVADPSHSLRVTSNVDMEQVMAWKNGKFDFGESTDIKSVMREISRWYDVEVSYEANIAPQRFGGKIQRNLKLSEALEGLQKSEVHFKIEGRKIVVTK